jgi:hypothetical protein
MRGQFSFLPILPPNPLKGALRRLVSHINFVYTLIILLFYESYERGDCFTMYSNEAFIYLEKVIEQTESKAITVLEPPLGGRG